MSSTNCNKMDSDSEMATMRYVKDLTQKNLQKIYNETHTQLAQKKELFNLKILAISYVNELKINSLQEFESEYQKEFPQELYNELSDIAQDNVVEQNNICMDQVDNYLEIQSRRSQSPEKVDKSENNLENDSNFEVSLNVAFLEENPRNLDNKEGPYRLEIPMLNYNSFGFQQFDSIEMPALSDKEDQVELVKVEQKNETPLKESETNTENFESIKSLNDLSQQKDVFFSKVINKENCTKPEQKAEEKESGDLQSDKIKKVESNSDLKISEQTLSETEKVESLSKLPNSDQKSFNTPKVIKILGKRPMNMLSGTQKMKQHDKLISDLKVKKPKNSGNRKTISAVDILIKTLKSSKYSQSNSTSPFK